MAQWCERRYRSEFLLPFSCSLLLDQTGEINFCPVVFVTVVIVLVSSNFETCPVPVLISIRADSIALRFIVLKLLRSITLPLDQLQSAISYSSSFSMKMCFRNLIWVKPFCWSARVSFAFLHLHLVRLPGVVRNPYAYVLGRLFAAIQSSWFVLYD